MAQSTAERQRAFRKRQSEAGLFPFTLYMTQDEKFYIERTLKSMRECNGTPAMIRNEKGQLEPIDV
jgi:hypothetical protein